MVLERLLQITICVLCVLGTVLLGMGERNLLLPIWFSAVVLAAFWLTDVTGWVRLNRLASNLGALAALGGSLLGVRHFGGFTQVFVIANLLVYLQIVLLLQRKELRIYGLLFLLSLLQVIVSAAFEQEVWFGLLLFGYLFVGLSALTLLYLYREQVRRQPRERPAELAAPGRWPLAQQEFRFTTLPAGRNAVGGALLLCLLRLTVAVSLISAVVFLLLPRLGRGSWSQAAGVPLRSVGFSSNVTLGELGQIIEDNHEVMRVQLRDPKTELPFHLNGAIYLRGAVLDTYTQGRWSCQAFLPNFRRSKNPMRHPPGEMRAPAPLVQPSRELIYQRITVEPLEEPELFSIWPCAVLQEDERLALNVYSQQLVRSQEMREQRFTYELVTPAVRGGQQLPLMPYADRTTPTTYLRPVRASGPNALPGLVRLAKEWSAEEASAEEAPASSISYFRALKLERQFRSSKQFRYSLQGQARNPQLDPLEDFVSEHRVGHCEYFASALVLMLRSQGIPARLVVGFKCDEWNELGQFYQVRQRDAHTWVEAYVAPYDIPEDARRQFGNWNWQRGGWLRLDPTPASDDLSLANRLLVRTDRYLSWLDYLWNRYVAEINLQQQQGAIYGPAMQAVSKVGQQLADTGRWRRLLAQLLAWGEGAPAFRWQGGLLVVGLGLLLFLLPRLLRRLGWLWAGPRTLRRRTRRRHSQPQVEFYRRLEALLARRGLLRDPGQTPREFAAQARGHLEQAAQPPQLVVLPEQVVDAFYQVRFGRASLDRVQAQAVEQALWQLERAVRARR